MSDEVAQNPDTQPDSNGENSPAVADVKSDNGTPEPATLSDGSILEVTQDTKHEAYSPVPGQQGEVTTVPHAVTITAPSGHRETIETESVDESSFYHKLILTLDRLGFRRG